MALGWSPEMGQDDQLYRKLEEIVHRILDGFTDDLGIFEVAREALQAYLTEEQTAAEINIQLSADEVNDRDRRHVAQSVARAETENRIASNVLPNFLADFLRDKWSRVLEAAYYAEGSEGEPWQEALATVDEAHPVAPAIPQRSPTFPHISHDAPLRGSMTPFPRLGQWPPQLRKLPKYPDSQPVKAILSLAQEVHKPSADASKGRTDDIDQHEGDEALHRILRGFVARGVRE
jgi:hypothetical protein